MAERKKVIATVVVGPEKLLGPGYKWAKVDIVKPRSAVSEKVKSFDIQPSPDDRWILTYEYVSGRSLGVNNRGTVSSRVYKRHRTEVVDEVTLKSEDGTVIGTYDENGKHVVRG